MIYGTKQENTDATEADGEIMKEKMKQFWHTVQICSERHFNDVGNVSYCLFIVITTQYIVMKIKSEIDLLTWIIHHVAANSNTKHPLYVTQLLGERVMGSDIQCTFFQWMLPEIMQMCSCCNVRTVLFCTCVLLYQILYSLWSTCHKCLVWCYF